MKDYQCKYKQECPQYDQDSVRCSYFYNWCKESRRRTKLSELEIDRIWNMEIKYHRRTK